MCYQIQRCHSVEAGTYFLRVEVKKTLKLLIPACFSVRTLLRCVLMWHVLADMESYNKSFGAISWA